MQWAESVNDGRSEAADNRLKSSSMFCDSAAATLVTTLSMFTDRLRHMSPIDR